MSLVMLGERKEMSHFRSLFMFMWFNTGVKHSCFIRSDVDTSSLPMYRPSPGINRCLTWNLLEAVTLWPKYPLVSIWRPVNFSSVLPPWQSIYLYSWPLPALINLINSGLEGVSSLSNDLGWFAFGETSIYTDASIPFQRRYCIRMSGNEWCFGILDIWFHLFLGFILRKQSKI